MARRERLATGMQRDEYATHVSVLVDDGN